MTTGNIYCDRLMALAAFLETVPDSNFDYGNYVANWDGKSTDLISCGSAACALGYSTVIPEIAALGVVIKPEKIEGLGYIGFKDSKMAPSEQPYEVAAKVFDLDNGEFYYLFIPASRDNSKGPGWDATAKEVAAHIRGFISKKYAELL